jgi:hypothetical protein
MATLAELWEAEAPAPVKSAKVPSQDQAMRDQSRMSILQSEMTKAQQRFAQGDTRAQRDIEALTREMGGKVARTAPAAPSAAPTATPTAAPATGGTLADLWESTPAATAKEQVTEEKPKEGGTAVGRMAAKLLGQVQEGKRALGEIITAPIAGAVTSVLGPATGIVATLRSGQYGTPEGIRIGQEQSENLQKQLSPEIRTPQAQAVLGGLQQAFEASKIPPVAMPELAGFAPLAVPAKTQALEIAGKATDAYLKEVQKSAAIAAKKLGVGELQVQPLAPPPSGMVSAGAAVVPDATTIKQALSVATPELQQAIASIPVDKVNLPTLQRHIEADTLPVPVRLTEGQATGDVVKLSNEQNRRGKDPVLAQRFNEQNGQLVENLGLIRDKAAPDVYGTKKIENSQGIIDAYKELDINLNKGIDADYQALRDAAGGQFPVDAPKLLQNIEAKLKKELLSNEAPKGQFSELQRLAKDKNMTFEDYLSLRRNLGDIARTSQDGSVRKAAGFMIEELEKLPLQKGAAALKPLADKARASARSRFQMLEKDPAMKAAVDDAVPADKFIDKFVVNGVNKNINTMVEHLGRDSPAHQHMAAGTVNWLTDKAGIVDGNGNFSQAGYNRALKQLDDVQNLNMIFNQEAASQLKTLGNVARYTQAQPRGAFVNNSNTLVGSLAEKAGKAVGVGVEGGLNLAVPGLQLGTSVMEMRARRAAEAQTRKALETGAGTKQTGKNKIQDLGK